MSTSTIPGRSHPRAGSTPDTGWAGFNYDTGLPRERLKEVLLHCAANDIRAIANANVTPGVLDLFEEVNRAISLQGRRWVVGHISTLSARDIEKIARMGLVVTTHTNRYIYKEAHLLQRHCRRGAPRDHADARSRRCGRQGGVGHRQRAGLHVLADLAGGRAHQQRHQGARAPEQAISRAQALRCATVDCGYATFDEHKKGSLEPGKFADLAVLSADPLAVSEDGLRDVAAAMPWSAAGSSMKRRIGTAEGGRGGRSQRV